MIPLRFFLLCLLAPLSAWSAPSANGAKQELQQLKQHIQALEKKITGAESSRHEVSDALRDSERAISNANRELAELEVASQATSARDNELKTQAARITSQVKQQQGALADMLYRQYLQQSVTGLDALTLVFSGKDPNEIARDWRYLSILNTARRDSINLLQQNVTTLHALQIETETKAKELAAIAKKQLAQRKKLEQEKNKRTALLNRLSRDIQQQRQQIGIMQKNEQRLSRLIEAIARLVTAPAKPIAPSPAPNKKNSSPPSPPATGSFAGRFAQLRGHLAFPVRGELSNHFGSPRIEGGLTWRGILLNAKSGESVRAISAGQVVYADWLRGFGNLLIIDHGEGYMSLYGFNETLLKRVGDAIQTGEGVATVGNSGGSTGSGLYFELRYQGKPIDPLGWIKGP